MSEKEKGTILEQAAQLPPLLKARAEGFMQGLTAGMAASAPQHDQTQKEQDKSDKRKG